jgi:hypothetical protein
LIRNWRVGTERTLAATYYAAWHHQGSIYSPRVRAELERLAK